MQKQVKRPLDPLAGAVSRRAFLRTVTGGVAAATIGTTPAAGLCAEPQSASPAKQSPDAPGKPFFKTRGVVLVPNDITTWPWVEKAEEAGLTTIGTHVVPDQVARFLETDKGQAFLEECRSRGIQVEHELHAMSALLPRKLFQKDPSMFRMDKDGNRTPVSNLCVHSKAALEVVSENAVKYAKCLKSTTGRYFYWIDDGKPMCACPKCKGLSDSDQALIVENAMVRELRRFDPRATLAHLSYARTLPAPIQVKPDPNVFLEFAPIARKYETPFGTTPREKIWLEHLDANLEVFRAASAQILEYWLDASMFFRATGRGGRRHRVPIPWNQEVFEADLAIYGKRGVRHITSFAVMVDGQYARQFGDPPYMQYGRGLKNWRPA